MTLPKKPNFFIIGAPKCGTTSVASWLSDHPNIYFSPEKEPHFFNTDHNFQNIKSLSEYEQLFNGVTSKHKAIGEGSVWYLYSTIAVKNILSYNSEAKFIVLLRSPVEMAISLHNQQIFTGHETIISFNKAWMMQDKRKNNCNIPFTCRESKHLLYGDACSLGSQIKNLYKTANKKNILPILLDDIKTNPKKEYKAILNFLGVQYDGRTKFPVRNKAKLHKSYSLNLLLYLISTKYKRCRSRIFWKLISHAKHWNISKKNRPDIPVETIEMLTKYFHNDICLLSEIIDKNLDHWTRQS